RWSHPRPEIRRALDEADAAGLKIEPTAAHGHSWGYIDCSCERCDREVRRFYVHSTPRDQDNHARKIRKFVARHRHEEE
ncbi:MAG: hypothetical protein J2P32_15150, partial [Actinobacteria bacterium]|nr:hypothetical protein [Actinomycetota bacterium]